MGFFFAFVFLEYLCPSEGVAFLSSGRNAVFRNNLHSDGIIDSNGTAGSIFSPIIQACNSLLTH